MKSVSWLLAGLVVAGSVQAIPQYGPGPMAGGMPMAAQAASPAQALRAGVDKLLAFLGTAPGPDALAAFLDQEIAPFFDFDYMTESAGGRQFERLSDTEKADMVDQVKTSFLAKMAEKLGGYDNQQVRFLPPRSGPNGTAQISVAVMNPGSYPARLDFRLYNNAGDWKVYDVAANGQSAIVHYRREFMRQMRQQAMQQMRQIQQRQQRQQRQRGPGPMMPPGYYGPGPVR